MEMEQELPASPAIDGLLMKIVSSANQWSSNKTEVATRQLIRSIEAVEGNLKVSWPCSIGSLRPQNLLGAECLTNLSSILTDPKASQSLLLQTLHFISLVGEDDEICESLRSVYTLLPILCNILQSSTHYDSHLILLAVELLQKLTYSSQVGGRDSSAHVLLNFITSTLQKQPAAAGGSGGGDDPVCAKEADPLLAPTLGLLTNLVRNNYSVQSALRETDRVRPLCKSIIPLLSSKDQRVVIYSLSVTASLGMNEELGEKLFNTKNISQTMQLIFNVVVKASSVESLRCASDLLADLTSHYQVQSFLPTYSSFPKFLLRIAAMLCSSEPTVCLKLFELLLALCSVSSLRCSVCRALLDTPTVRKGLTCTLSSPSSGQPKPPSPSSSSTSTDTQSTGSSASDNGGGRRGKSGGSFLAIVGSPGGGVPTVNEPLYALLHWAGQCEHHSLSVIALRLLEEVYRGFLESEWCFDANFSLVVDAAKKSLSSVFSGTDSNKLRLRVINALKLLAVMVSSEHSKRYVVEEMSADGCVQLVQKFCEVPPADRMKKEPREEEEVLLQILTFMLIMTQHSPDYREALISCLKNASVLPSVAYGLSSTSKVMVQTSMRLTVFLSSSEPESLDRVCDAAAQRNASIKATAREFLKNQENGLLSQGTTQDSAPPGHILSGQSWTGGDNSYVRGNHSQLGNGMGRSNGMGVSKMEVSSSSANRDATVEALIEKMSSGMEVKDIRTSDLIAVYEHKLQSLQTKEVHQQDLLEAKTLALSQADRLIQQYRCRMGQADSETQKLRTLMHDSERQNEGSRDQIGHLFKEQKSLQAELERLHNDYGRLEILSSEQSQKLETLQRVLSALKQEHGALKEMHDTLQKYTERLKEQHIGLEEQYNQLTEDKRLLTHTLKDRESKLNELKKHQERQDECLHSLYKDKTELEEKERTLQKEVNRLRAECAGMELDLKEREEMIRDHRSELEKNAQIVSLINQLSSGKVPPQAASS